MWLHFNKCGLLVKSRQGSAETVSQYDRNRSIWCVSSINVWIPVIRWQTATSLVLYHFAIEAQSGENNCPPNTKLFQWLQ